VLAFPPLGERKERMDEEKDNFDRSTGIDPIFCRREVKEKRREGEHSDDKDNFHLKDDIDSIRNNDNLLTSSNW
jgi:hypothetical protein